MCLFIILIILKNFKKIISRKYFIKNKELLISDKASVAIGSYSAASKVGNLIFTSRQLPINPKTEEIVEGDIEAKIRMALENLKVILESYSIPMENIVKNDYTSRRYE